MFRRTIAPETTPAAAHGRHADQVLLDVREDDEWAAEALRGAGIDAVNVAGGMKAWAATGLPVVRDDGRRGRVV